MNVSVKDWEDEGPEEVAALDNDEEVLDSLRRVGGRGTPAAVWPSLPNCRKR